MSAQDPQDLFHAAAVAAASLLPDLIRQRDALVEKVRRMEAIVEAAGLSPVAATPEQAAEPTSPVAKDIDTILSEEGPMKAGTLVERIKTRLGHHYAGSTVYRYLGIGYKSGKYLNERQFWRINPAHDLV